MSRARWCARLGAADFDVDVGGARHRITWRAGRLRLHAHDVEAEAVLRALGGEPCLCLLVLDALRDGSMVVGRPAGLGRRVATYGPSLAPRPAPRPFPVSAAIAQLKASQRFAAMQPVQQAAVLARLRQHSLVEVLPARMLDVVAQVNEIRRERRLRRHVAAPAEVAVPAARLQAAVAPGAAEAMRRARRDLRPYAALRVECRLRRKGETPLLEGTLDGTGGSLRLSLPVSWLCRVWARGLAVVDGHLVVDVDRPAPAVELDGLAIRWERGRDGSSAPVAVPCRIARRADRSWFLMW